MKTLLITWLFSSVFLFDVFGQEIVQPTKSYKGGEIILAPHYGLQLEIPSHWTGYLSRGTGIFTLYSDSTNEATALYFVNETSLDKIKNNWKSGFELAPQLDIQLRAKPTMTEDLLIAPVQTNTNNMYKGYLIAKCGPYGYCVTVLMYTPQQYISEFENKIEPLLNQVSFTKPRVTDANQTFDWRKNLTGKMIFTFEREESSSQENKIWLYYDGSFKSKTKRTGIFIGSAGKYHGTKKGNYTIINAEGDKPATLQLDFYKQPALTLPLHIVNNQYYINDHLVYFMELD
ncbi:hypothetical protein [Reichenbachiella agariperforans]|uniref:hypothetical protein n=1 Tax=Reichenbachiella agariperforans TaxID=156994 RepID=UPI001C08D4F7|nr:hypothetical protein [Reichenbachiella agariperforans]MBU2914731.1 hypothetical protein [Reichenbachiella agariperforans]